MPIPFKQDPIEFKQRLLFPTNVFDLLPRDHECFIYETIFEQLDTSRVEQNYSVLGQNAYHPRLITAILIYAYSQGVFSSRQIAKRCRQDLSFMCISRMHCPDFRVLSDFRKNNPEFLKECFIQSVILARELGLASLAHVSADGSKFKANTSKHKAMSYKYLQAAEERLTQHIDQMLEKAEQCDSEEDREYQDQTGYEIPEELKDKRQRLAKVRAAKTALEQRENELHPGKPIEGRKQISFADHDARIMNKHGEFDYNYNAQISVDDNNQIIVGQHVSQNANDACEVGAIIEEIKSTTGELPEKMSLDNGYLSGENLEQFGETGIDVYIATGREGGKDEVRQEDAKGKIQKSDFIYNVEDDSFVCPNGTVLPLRRKAADGRKFYQAPKDECDACPLKSRCCQSKKGEPRTIAADDKEPLRQKMRKKMGEESSKQIYKRRKCIVEPVFGQIKNLGFRGFLLRGLRKVMGEFSLVCAVHNFKKIVWAVLRGEVRLGAGQMAAIGG